MLTLSGCKCQCILRKMTDLRVILILIVFVVTYCHMTLPLTPKEIERLKTWTEIEEQNIWEISGQYEGDIIFPGDHQRNGFKNPQYLWDNKEVPFEIDPIFDKTQEIWIKEALEMFNKLSCLKVRPRNIEDVNYVYITAKTPGCYSYVGRIGGRQIINLQQSLPGIGCLRFGVIQHEFLHALGFFHQQSASKRDNYVNIRWENIQTGREHNFDKQNEDMVYDYGVPYDYESIMHYSKYAFSANGLKTIIPKVNNVQVGQRVGMSVYDIVKLNKMYNCSNNLQVLFRKMH